MSQTILTFTHRVNGTLANATSVVLSDPTGAFGVKRTDTDAVVVADGTAMTNVSTGVYTYTITDPAADLTYSYYVEWVYAGITHRAEFSAAGSSDVSVVSGYYADGSDLEEAWGIENVARWSQLDNSSTNADTSRIAAALAFADAEINSFFRGSAYAVPLSPSDPVVTNWVTAIAGAWLYNSRGIRDDDLTGAKLTTQRDEAYVDMAKYRGGMKRLGAGNSHSYMPTVPVVVE